MSIIDTLITNRIDGATYNRDDLNRVGEAMIYIADILTGYGYHVPVSPKTDWTRYEFPEVALIERYMSDLTVLRDAISNLPVPDVIGQNCITPEDANQIERILYELNEMIGRMATTFIPCGEAITGEDNL